MKSKISSTQNIFLFTSFFVFASFAAGCATISTGAHYDETTNFGMYKRFSWIDDQPLILGSIETGITVGPLTQSKIKRAVRSGFQSKGYIFVDDREQADFVVAYTIGTRQEVSIDSYPTAYYGTWGWHVRGSHYYINEVSAHTYTKGTLGVDVFDRAAKKPVWHGWAEKTITADDRKDPSPAIDAAVGKLLESFPR